MKVGYKSEDEYIYILLYEVFLIFALSPNQKYSTDAGC